MNRTVFLTAVFAVVAVILRAPAVCAQDPAHTASAPTSAEPSVTSIVAATLSPEDLADQALGYRVVTQLKLSAGQTRQIVELLSTYDRLAQDFRTKERAAVDPVSNQIRRVNGAMATGRAPETADQAAVTVAIGVLRTLDISLQRKRSETITAIRDVLTPEQIAKLRAGDGDLPAAGVEHTAERQNPADPGDVMHQIERQRAEAQQDTATFIGQKQQEMQTIQQEMQKLDQEDRDAQAHPQPVAQDPAQQGDEQAAAFQQQIAEAARQVEVARKRVELVEQASKHQIEMTQRMAQFAEIQVALMQKMAAAHAQFAHGGERQAADPQAVRGALGAGRDFEILTIEHLFMGPKMLSFLRARAAQ